MYYISLRISSDSATVQHIADVMQMKADAAFDKGEHSFYRDEEIVHKETSWIKEIAIKDKTYFEKAVDDFISVL